MSILRFCISSLALFLNAVEVQKQDKQNGKVRCYTAKLIADIYDALVISFIFFPIHFLSVRVC